ncbi:MAG: hypothetical protein FK733_17670 [Asgard group archaeon]|nr:hypothetical protein [Asgard group archaeon]
MKQIDDKNWQALHPKEVKSLLDLLTIPWCIAGGWAIDLFVGKQTRKHLDTDILILRKDQFIIKDYLSDWLLYKTSQPGLQLWDAREFLEIGINSVWCKKDENTPWLLQIMFMDSEKDEWLYRREPTIRGPLSQLYETTKESIPFLTPEVQLLFKAKRYSVKKNDQDFQNALPLLSSDQKKWLINSLTIEFPNGHKWIDVINSYK